MGPVHGLQEFDAALAHYSKAIELYSDDISFLTNRAAVHYEMQNYDACIADCDEAVVKVPSHALCWKDSPLFLN